MSGCFQRISVLYARPLLGVFFLLPVCVSGGVCGESAAGNQSPEVIFSSSSTNKNSYTEYFFQNQSEEIYFLREKLDEKDRLSEQALEKQRIKYEEVLKKQKQWAQRKYDQLEGMRQLKQTLQEKNTALTEALDQLKAEKAAADREAAAAYDRAQKQEAELRQQILQAEKQVERIRREQQPERTQPQKQEVAAAADENADTTRQQLAEARKELERLRGRLEQSEVAGDAAALKKMTQERDRLAEQVAGLQQQTEQLERQQREDQIEAGRSRSGYERRITELTDQVGRLQQQNQEAQDAAETAAGLRAQLVQLQKQSATVPLVPSDTDGTEPAPGAEPRERLQQELDATCRQLKQKDLEITQLQAETKRLSLLAAAVATDNPATVLVDKKLADLFEENRFLEETIRQLRQEWAVERQSYERQRTPEGTASSDRAESLDAQQRQFWENRVRAVEDKYTRLLQEAETELQLTKERYELQLRKLSEKLRRE